MIAPHELKNKVFNKAVRGYNCSEVTEYIEFILEQYTELYRENSELKNEVVSAEFCEKSYGMYFELLSLLGFEKKKAEVIFAMENGKEVGFALFFHNFSTFVGRAGIYLEDLFVLPEYRGKGYGKGLLQALARITEERGCGRLEWCCLDWNKPSIDFYLSLGARQMNGWTIYRTAGESLKNLAE